MLKIFLNHHDLNFLKMSGPNLRLQIELVGANHPHLARLLVILRFACKRWLKKLHKYSTNGDGGEKWWFTTVQSFKKNIRKQKHLVGKLWETCHFVAHECSSQYAPKKTLKKRFGPQKLWKTKRRSFRCTCNSSSACSATEGIRTEGKRTPAVALRSVDDEEFGSAEHREKDEINSPLASMGMGMFTCDSFFVEFYGINVKVNIYLICTIPMEPTFSLILMVN